MELALRTLNDEQRGQVALFQEVTENARDTVTVVQLLESCNWNLEQAVSLHMEEGQQVHRPPPAPAPAPRSPPGQAFETTGSYSRREFGAALLQPVQRPRPPPPAAARADFLCWVCVGCRRLGADLANLVRTFLFGGAARGLVWETGSGATFRNALASMYGRNLQLPQFFEGTFQRALEAARRDLKLVVVYLNDASRQPRQSRAFSSDVLGDQTVREMLDQNFVVWGGDASRAEPQLVAQAIGVRAFPAFSVVLPASMDDIRVIGAMVGDMQVDSVLALLTASIGDLESHRSEMLARQLQSSEDRHLRQQQDREYQEAMAADNRLAEERRLKEAQEREERRTQEEKEAALRRQEEERQHQEREEAEGRERAKQQLQGLRRQLSLELPAEDAEATARIALRLPGGQRLQRKFRPTATLKDVYDWAQAAAHLPENEGKGLHIPERFTLKTSNPVRDLTEKGRTIGDLQLSGSMILLAELEEDDL